MRKIKKQDATHVLYVGLLIATVVTTAAGIYYFDAPYYFWVTWLISIGCILGLFFLSGLAILQDRKRSEDKYEMYMFAILAPTVWLWLVFIPLFLLQSQFEAMPSLNHLWNGPITIGFFYPMTVMLLSLMGYGLYHAFLRERSGNAG